jgi:hypothetical protein
MIAVIGGPGDKGERPSFGKRSADEDESGDSGPSIMEMGSKRYAKDILAAVESGDVGALDKALKRHYEVCAGGSE